MSQPPVFVSADLALLTVLTDGILSTGSETNTINGNVGYDPAATRSINPLVINGTIYNTTTTEYIDAYTGPNGLDYPLTGTIADIQSRTSTGTLLTFPRALSYTIEPGVYDCPNGLNVNLMLNLDGQSNSDSIFIFRLGENEPLTIGESITLINGALAQNVFFYAPGASNTITINNNVTINGIFICDNQIILNDTLLSRSRLVNGLTLNGNLWTAPSGSVTLEAGDNPGYTITINGEAQAFTGADPHVICLDGSRLDIYDGGFYQFAQFDDFTLNVEVARNKRHVDYYKHAYIQYGSKKITVRFANSGLIIDDCGTALPKVDVWSHTYRNKNTYFTVIFEKAHKAIGIKTNKTGDVSMSGLCVGEIIPMGYLSDVTTTGKKVVQVCRYGLNALLSGSNDPHIVTTQGKKLEMSDGYFRLLEFGSNILNCHMNIKGEIDQLQVFKTNSDSKSWLWTGEEHWNLKCYCDGQSVDRAHKHEELIQVDNGEILLRIQANGSVSVGLKNTGSTARGLFTNDIVKLSGLDDKSNHVYGQMDENLVADPAASMYARKVEKHMAQI
jgi:hypothetical protein